MVVLLTAQNGSLVAKEQYWQFSNREIFDIYSLIISLIFFPSVYNTLLLLEYAEYIDNVHAFMWLPVSNMVSMVTNEIHCTMETAFIFSSVWDIYELMRHSDMLEQNLLGSYLSYKSIPCFWSFHGYQLITMEMCCMAHGYLMMVIINI